MALPKVIAQIESLIGESDLEQALDLLMQLLQGDPKYAELEKDVRINQADYYNLKSQQIRGIISAEDERLNRNKITDNLLHVLQQLKSGRTTAAQNDDPEPSASRKWYYYLIGAAVALAIAGVLWYFSGSNPCPKYNSETDCRVLVLPFLQTGVKQTSSPAVELADGLNVLFGNTPDLNRAEALVGKHEITEKTYPSFLRAEEIGKECGVQMVVWGKIRQISDTTYTLDVRYKLTNNQAGVTTGDTTLSTVKMSADGAMMADTNLTNLLKMEAQKELYRDHKVRTKDNLTEDMDAATRYLYAVLANHLRAPVAANFWQTEKGLPAGVASDMPSIAVENVEMSLLKAENYLQTGDTAKAIKAYSEVIRADPANKTAYTKRGALLYAQKQYAAATKDLKAAAPTSKNTAPDILKTRIESAIKGGQPAQAQEDLKVYSTKTKDAAWVKKKGQEVQDSLKQWEKVRQKQEKLANKKPNDRKANIAAAQANIAVGDSDRAEQYAAKVIKTDPKNIPALEILVDANLAQGDTIKAQKVIEDAMKKGVNIQSLEKWQRIGAKKEEN